MIECSKLTSLLTVGWIYTRDGSSVWDELGQRRIALAHPIIRLCINTGKQTDHPSRRLSTKVRGSRRTITIMRLDG